MPPQPCQTTFSLQRWQSSSSLRLKACLRYSSATIKRIGKRGRPALLRPAPASCAVGPKRSASWTRRPIAILVRQRRSKRGFDGGPGHARGQHRQRVAHVDHGVQPRAKEVVGGHRLHSPKLPGTGTDWNQSWEIALLAFTPHSEHRCGPAGICRADYVSWRMLGPSSGQRRFIIKLDAARPPPSGPSTPGQCPGAV